MPSTSKKKSTKRAKSGKSVDTAQNKSATGPPETAARVTPALNDLPAPSRRLAGRLRFGQLLADTLGRVFRGVSTWLDHERLDVRILAWIVCLVPLGTIVTAVLIAFLKWDGPQFITVFCTFTGLATLMNIVNRLSKRNSK
jgi:hypothetical protein